MRLFRNIFIFLLYIRKVKFKRYNVQPARSFSNRTLGQYLNLITKLENNALIRKNDIIKF